MSRSPKEQVRRARSAPGIFDPNVFLRIDADNTVTILSKHFEMGQGITTGLATLVAEELEADWSQMRVAFAPNDPKLYNNLALWAPHADGRQHLAVQLLGADAQGGCRGADHAGDGCRVQMGRSGRGDSGRERRCLASSIQAFGYIR